MINEGMVTEIQRVNISKLNISVVLTKERVGQGINDYFINIENRWFLEYAQHCMLLDSNGIKGRIKFMPNNLDKEEEKYLEWYLNFIERLNKIITHPNNYVTFLHIVAEIFGL